MINDPHTEQFEVTVNAIIPNDEGNVLLLKHHTGKWLLPGGRIQKGESPAEALQREITEETGIVEVFITDILDVDSWQTEHAPRLVITYITESVDQKTVIPRDGHSEVAWVNEETITQYDVWHENITSRIIDALKKL